MKYLFTERAHLMCPNMCFGIALLADRTFDEARIRETAAALAKAHPFLNARIGWEEASNAYYYDVTGEAQTELLIKSESVSGADAPEIFEEYDRITQSGFDLLQEGMLKLAAWQAGEKTVFLLVFHHLLADGRAALALAKELADYYVSGVEPIYAEERLITADDLPRDSRMPLISRLLVKRANRAWIREDQMLTYAQYRQFEKEFLKNDPVAHRMSIVGKEELSGIHAECRSHQVSVNDYLLAKLFTEESAGKAVIACDLRNPHVELSANALGNFSTAFSISVSKRGKDRLKRGEDQLKHGEDHGKDSEELFTLARKVHAAVQRKLFRPRELYLVLQCYANLEPGLLDAAMISSRGGYGSRAGRFIGTMFFGYGTPSGYSITNLGRMDSASMEDAFFIPPASPAMKKTLGVLTVNGRMRICTSEH